MSWGARHLSVELGGHRVLDDLSLDVAPGRIVGLVGGDGAGKSTALRSLVGLVRVSAGLVEMPARHRLGYMPASSGSYPDLTVDENLAFVAAAYGLGASTAHERADRLLERAGLVDARSRLGGQLSGGMRQKLGVIMAMLHEPDVLVLDEPTTGVDPVSRAELWRLITRAAADGAAVGFSTTYLDEASRAAELYVLEAGRVLASGSPAGIVAATPGTLWSVRERPHGESSTRSWRRGREWRLWQPARGEPGMPPGEAEGERVEPDLQDAVIVAALAHRAESSSPSQGAA